jgi:hypothetical protein
MGVGHARGYAREKTFIAKKAALEKVLEERAFNV